MTSSVPARIEGGTVRPSALAVLRLTTSSNRHRAGEKNYEIASPHARPLALTASRDYGSKGPPRIGWAKGSFPPQADQGYQASDFGLAANLEFPGP
jgi:hypothetical protein